MAGGESRHWIHFETSPIKENENRGGAIKTLFPNDDEVIPMHGQRNILQLGSARPIENRGGFEQVNEIIPSKPSHDTKIQERNKLHVEHARGGFDWKPFILESFYYADKDTERLIPYFGDFLLDSGAFTFMQNSKVATDWNDYVERYADFINRNKIEKFFELDIDSVVGYEEVKKLRAKLENLTGKQVIPVWHKSRGKEEFEKMCAEYPYVAIGGIVSKEITRDQYKYFPYLIRLAHKRKTKIHGLGFTNLEGLTKYHFDSVDSTAWTTGNRFGYIYQFDGMTMQKVKVPQGKRIMDSRGAALINYLEWLKFQRYAERCL